MMKVQMVDDDLNDMTMETVVTPDACKGPTPAVTVTSTCRFKMHALAKVVYREFRERDGALEAFAFLLGSRMGHAEDIVIPEQEASGAFVSVDPRAVLAIRPEIDAKNKEREKINEGIRSRNAETAKKNEEIRAGNAERADRGGELVPEEKLLDELKPLQIVGWTHSHNLMSAFSSGTDDANHKRIHDELVLSDLKKDAKSTAATPVPFYIIGITVNVKKEECGVIYASQPCGLARQYTGVSIREIDDASFTREQMEAVILDILSDVRKKVKTRSTVWAPSRREWRSTPVTRTLDNYMRREDRFGSLSTSTISSDDLVKKLDEEASIEAIVKCSEVLPKIVAIQKACGGKDSKIYQEVKEYLRGIIETERTLIITKAGEVSGKPSKIDLKEFIMYDDMSAKKLETPAGKIGGAGEPEKCGSCGKTIAGGDGEEKDQFSGYTNDDGNPICMECGAEEDRFELAYYDEDGTPIRCSDCNGKIVEGENYLGDQDDDGLPLCVQCAPAHDSGIDRAEVDDPELDSGKGALPSATPSGSAAVEDPARQKPGT